MVQVCLFKTADNEDGGGDPYEKDLVCAEYEPVFVPVMDFEYGAFLVDDHARNLPMQHGVGTTGCIIELLRQHRWSGIVLTSPRAALALAKGLEHLVQHHDHSNMRNQVEEIMAATRIWTISGATRNTIKMHFPMANTLQGDWKNAEELAEAITKSWILVDQRNEEAYFLLLKGERTMEIIPRALSALKIPFYEACVYKVNPFLGK